MKKYLTIALLITISLHAFTQEISAEKQKVENQPANQNAEKTEVILGNNAIRISDEDSIVDIRVGDKGIKLLESLEGKKKISVEKYNREEENDEETDEWYQDEREDRNRERRGNRFRGNWSGIEFGYNNYTTSRSNLTIPDEINYMSIHSGKSFNFNLNFAQLSLGITRHIGFVTGLGLNWNNYIFDNNNNIQKTTNGIIQILDPGIDLKKSKFSTTYVTLPFLLEFQLPVHHRHINIAGGPIGAMKIGSKSKMVTEDGKKIRTNSDFSLNMFRHGMTLRAGYSNFQLYGTYYVTPLFQKGKGPGNYELYPFEVGMAFTFND
jgi:hypothetical protein